MKLELVGVPYTSAREPGGIAEAVRVLRAAGLAERLAEADVRDAGDLDPLPGSGTRGASDLLNEEALARLVAVTRSAVSGILGRGRLPLLVGGDCPVLLGALAAGRERFGGAGLLLVDGHEDAWPPSASTTGEASDSELAIALGLVDRLPAPLDELVPLVAPEAVALLGPRDLAQIRGAGLESLAGSVALLWSDEAVRARGAAAAARTAIERLPSAFWLHVDLDVLGPNELPAVDYPQPGGLDWDELLAISTGALGASGCFGCSIAIYNPDLDPRRSSAARIVEFAAELASARR